MRARVKGAAALGTLIAVPLASAEAAEAILPADMGGGTPSTTTPDPPTGQKPAGKRPPARDVSGHPTNPTGDVSPPPARERERVEPREYADDRREPMGDVSPPPARIRERVEPRDLKPREVEPREYADDRREPVREPVRNVSGHPTNPTINVEAPPIGDQVRPPGAPRTADAAERYLKARQGEPVDYTPPEEPVVSDESDEPEEDEEIPMSTLPGPGDRPGESPEDKIEGYEAGTDDEEDEPVEEEEPVEEDDGVSFGVDLPGDRFDASVNVDVDAPDVDMPDIDPEWVTNFRGKLAEEQEDAGEASAEGITTAAEATKTWMDQRPMCAGGTVYRYGGGGGEVCIDTRTGETSWKGQLGVGAGGTIKVHRPESLPQNLYCGGGATISSPVVYGTYERRYDFTEDRWYNAYEYGLSVPYKGTKYLPVDGGSWRPSKGRHVAGRGDRKPPTGTGGRHRATPSPSKTVKSYVKPGSAAVYGVCGGPGPDLY